MKRALLIPFSTVSLSSFSFIGLGGPHVTVDS
jgi:hypothetical protein